MKSLLTGILFLIGLNSVAQVNKAYLIDPRPNRVVFGVGITLPANSTTAGTAPIKLTSGTAMTTPEDGALEYHSSHLWFTIGSTRFQLDQQGGGGGGVSSVGLTMPSGFSVSGSPVTSSGTLAVTTTLNGILTGNGSGFSAITTSSGLAGILSDEVGTAGGVVLSNSPSITTPTFITNITAPLIYGSSASGGDITIQSTSNATKGDIFFGTTSTYSQVNDRWGFGTTSPTHGLTLAQTQALSGVAFYKTTDQVTNYGRSVIRQRTSGTTPIMEYDIEIGGTVTGGYHSFMVHGVEKLSIDATQAIFSGNFLFGTDNTYDIGRVSVSPFRPRNVYIANGAQIGLAANTTLGARLHIGAGSASANTAPIKLTSGTLLSSAEAGTIEYDGTNFYMSPSTTRKRIPLINNATPSNGQLPIGNGTDFTVANILSAGGTIEISNSAGGINLEVSSGSLATSGSYTPTLTNITNISSSTAFQCYWTRIGNQVHVWGSVVIDPSSANAQTILTMSLPVFTDFELPFDADFASGTAGIVPTATVSGVGVIQPATGNTVTLTCVPNDAGSQKWKFHFSYLVVGVS